VDGREGRGREVRRGRIWSEGCKMSGEGRSTGEGVEGMRRKLFTFFAALWILYKSHLPPTIF